MLNGRVAKLCTKTTGGHLNLVYHVVYRSYKIHAALENDQFSNNLCD